MDDTDPEDLNGLDPRRLRESIEAIRADPGLGQVGFRVRTTWTGGTRSETVAEGLELGSRVVPRRFRFSADEPRELLGTDLAPSPQELFLGALSACLVAGWVANASARGIRLRGLTIETDGRMDLRGFLGIDPRVPPGNETLRYRVRVSADAPRETLAEIHAAVRRRSPVYFNLSRPVLVEGELLVE